MSLRAAGIGLLVCLATSSAWAEGGRPRATLAAAEHAYQDVDFPATQELARGALQSGHATHQQTARLYVLLGVAAAALGNSEEAKQDFTVALAVEPSLHLDRTLSPKIRDPYLEAQGYWAAAPERLGISAKPTSDGAHLVISLLDPAALVSKVDLELAPTGAPERRAFPLEAAAQTRFALPAQLRKNSYEYVLRALDRYGNVLTERGTDADPVVVPKAALATDREPADLETRRDRSYFLPTFLGITGVGAVAAGVVFHVRREQAAHEWNGPQCENPGQTRLEQCSDLNASRQNDERLAIGLYAGGGALLTGSLIALLTGGANNTPPDQHTGLAGCAVQGAGLSCLAHF